MMFTILFGLSMDYEVFLLSRIREEWRRTGDNSAAVADGLAKTARVITAAAAIMICVFGSFVIGDPLRVLKVFGLGLAASILIDATLVRMVLVPSVMELLGRANWYMPAVARPDRAPPRGRGRCGGHRRSAGRYHHARRGPGGAGACRSERLRPPLAPPSSHHPEGAVSRAPRPATGSSTGENQRPARAHTGARSAPSRFTPSTPARSSPRLGPGPVRPHHGRRPVVEDQPAELPVGRRPPEVDRHRLGHRHHPPDRARPAGPGITWSST